MSEKNDVVIINLDRPRELRYGHKAIKKLSSMLGKDLDAAMDLNNVDMDELEKIMYCGLLYDAKQNNETLKLEDMEDIMDEATSYVDMIQKLTDAFNKAFGGFEDVEKNFQGIAAMKEKPVNGAGKNL